MNREKGTGNREQIYRIKPRKPWGSKARKLVKYN